jgi:peptidoglycan/LPS O-acetylase OafA/YrhL
MVGTVSSPSTSGDSKVGQLAPAIVDPGKEYRSAHGIPVVPAFDGYRAYAILGVVLLHLLGRSGVLSVAGSNWFGQLVDGTLQHAVEILFIISGFVVFLPTVARRGEFGHVPSYAVRRAARLVPAYWAVLAILVVLTSLIAVNPPIPVPGVDNVAIHVVFLQMPAGLVRDFGPVGFGNDPAVWTLSLEVTFYVLLPFFAARYFRRPLVGLLIAAAITVVWREALIHWSWTEGLLGHPSPATSARLQLFGSLQFPFYAFSFAAGMTGAWAYVRLRERVLPEQNARWVRRVQIAALASLAVFCFVLGYGTSGTSLVAKNSPIIALGFTASLTTLMVAMALGVTRWQRPFAHPLARRLGDISYGIFLIHLVVITYAVRLLFEHSTANPSQYEIVNANGSLGTFVALAVIVLPLSVGYGYFSGRYLEQPIRRWAHRFGRRAQVVPASQPTAKAGLRG